MSSATPEPTPQRNNTRSMTPSDNGAVWTRLWSPSPSQMNAKPLAPLQRPVRALTPAVEKESIERLSHRSVRSRQQALAQLDETVYGRPPPAAGLDRDEADQLVARMYNQRMLAKQETAAKLRSHYLAKSVVTVKTFKDKVEKAAAIDRLFNTRAKDKERSAELFELHNPPTPLVKRAPQEIQSNVKRWFDGGFAKKA